MAVRFDEKAVAALEQSYLTPEIVHQRARMLDTMPLRAGAQVLDLGCGVGLLSEQLSARVGDAGCVVACDQSEAMVRATHARCAPLGNVEVLEANVCALPFDAARFDVAAIAQVLLYVEQPAVALAELFRVLRPGGSLVVVETDWRGVVLATDYPELVPRIFSAWDAAVPSPGLPTALQPLLREAGFVLESVEAIPVLNTDWHADCFSVPMVHDVTRLALKRQRITQAEADDFRADMQARGARGDYLFCVNRFLFAASRQHAD